MGWIFLPAAVRTPAGVKLRMYAAMTLHIWILPGDDPVNDFMKH